MGVSSAMVLLRWLFLFLVTTAALAADRPPPLVLEPNEYSYTFGVPSGWDYSFEQAHEFNVPLVFFPVGGSFHTSPAVIYINTICTLACTSGPIETAIDRVVFRAKQHSPNLNVDPAPKIPTRAGGEAIVRILTGSQDPRQLREALAFITHDQVTILVTLTSKDIGTWDKDYKAFRYVVSGHKFFDCRSLDLAIRCR
jgi:hypothetical protein